jgi:hypothetical protein
MPSRKVVPVVRCGMGSIKISFASANLTFDPTTEALVLPSQHPAKMRRARVIYFVWMTSCQAPLAHRRLLDCRDSGGSESCQ